MRRGLETTVTRVCGSWHKNFFCSPNGERIEPCGASVEKWDKVDVLLHASTKDAAFVLFDVSCQPTLLDRQENLISIYFRIEILTGFDTRNRSDIVISTSANATE